MPVGARSSLLPRVPHVFLLLALSSVGMPICGQTLEIGLIDGRNGRPIPNSCVNVWIGGAQKDALAIPSDKDGAAHLRLTNKDDDGYPKSLEGLWRVWCDQSGRKIRGLRRSQCRLRRVRAARNRFLLA